MSSNLRSEFEQQLLLEVTTAGTVLIGDLELTPAAILASDPTAYEVQFASWLYSIWVPERLERLEAILGSHGNGKRYEDLCAAAGNSQVVPFVGSGMSAPSGLPTWSDFLRSIRKYSKLSETDLDKLLCRSAFEEAAAELAKAMPDRLFDERVAHDLRADTDAIGGPVRYLPVLFPQLVITSNLDHVLETVYEWAGKTFGHILLGTNIKRLHVLEATTESFLLKLHGDCDTSSDRVLTPDEYARVYADDADVMEELSIIFRTRNVLFLGCSVQSDRTVELVARVAREYASMPNHYALLNEPAAEDERLEREHFLTERGIFPIWYADEHDECIEVLLVGILSHLGRIDDLRGGPV